MTYPIWENILGQMHKNTKGGGSLRAQPLFILFDFSTKGCELSIIPKKIFIDLEKLVAHFLYFVK